jgi:hypothetical protein
MVDPRSAHLHMQMVLREYLNKSVLITIGLLSVETRTGQKTS